MPPREEVITVGATKVQVLIGGEGDPLVVLHGAGGNRGWRRWMDAVAERHTIYAPTHPGFGRSDAADWMEGIDDLARFYLWFLDVMGLRRCTCSATRSAAGPRPRWPRCARASIDRLVLVAPAGLKPEVGEILDIFYLPAGGAAQAHRARSGDDPGVRRALRPAAHAGGGGDRAAQPGDGRAPHLEALHVQPAAPHFLPRVTAPTLLLWGREDGIVPVICGEQYRRLLPNATLRVLERCGHLPLIEQPDEFASAGARLPREGLT